VNDYEDMIGERPALVSGGDMELEAWGGSTAERSTGLILTWRDKLVFGLALHALPIGARGRQDVCAFVGIGGHLEAGEQWHQAVVREAQEEANCPISLGDSAVTYFCREGESPRPIAYRWSEPYRPLLVWTATFNLRRGTATLVNAVFRAAALGRPAPGAEIDGLLLMDQETLIRTYRAPRPLGELLDCGAQVIGEMPPPDTLLAPGGSAYFYGAWLDWQERDEN
jgi:8-oxo-dGTP pyrophosphatase MutT (NUDIX family)